MESMCEQVTREGVIDGVRVRAREWGLHWDIHPVECGIFTGWKNCAGKNLTAEQVAIFVNMKVDELMEWAQDLQN